MVTEPSVAAVLPTVNSMTQTVRRTRNKNEMHPVNPRNLIELELADEYKTTFKGEEFLLFDSGPAMNRLLIFGTSSNLKFLKECDEWYLDGTFKTAPPLFSQLYTIHGMSNKRSNLCGNCEDITREKSL